MKGFNSSVPKCDPGRYIQVAFPVFRLDSKILHHWYCITMSVIVIVWFQACSAGSLLHWVSEAATFFPIRDGNSFRRSSLQKIMVNFWLHHFDYCIHIIICIYIYIYISFLAHQHSLDSLWVGWVRHIFISNDFRSRAGSILEQWALPMVSAKRTSLSL